MAAAAHAPRRFTGYHIAAILSGGFAVVIAVNFAMAFYASSTFGGVVVENSYIASQHFNRWLDEAEREKALGWQAEASLGSDGRVLVATHGLPVGAQVSAIARHPLGRHADAALDFEPDGEGGFVSRQSLAADRWTIRLAIEAAGKVMRREVEVR